jgi:predicted TIM-barrel fold metal-dependent hydrolase
MLWQERMPARLRERAIRPVREGDLEIVYADGIAIRRNRVDSTGKVRAPGFAKPAERLQDLEQEQIWAELLFPSLGLWIPMCTDPELAAAMSRVYNDWLFETFMTVSPRFIGTAVIPTLEIETAVEEIGRVKDLGYQAVNLPCTPPAHRPYNSREYDPIWGALEEARLRLCFHVGTGADPIVARGDGGAVINYVETFFPAQRLVAHLVASGALDRYPELQVMVVEGGASWIPSLMERMDEGYRQHGMWAKPKLSAMPSEIMRRQVHATFQHDRALMATLEFTGSKMLMWGSDYPHFEGTWPNSQAEIEKIFGGSDPVVRAEITGQNMADLFHLPDPPTSCRSDSEQAITVSKDEGPQ